LRWKTTYFTSLFTFVKTYCLITLWEF
jgi:hypothetical protein